MKQPAAEGKILLETIFAGTQNTTPIVARTIA